MSEMVRKQIYVSKRQDQLLKRLSKKYGLSEAEIIRQAIDLVGVQSEKVPLRQDDENWQALVSLMESTGTDDRSEPYHWRREDAYEERFARYAIREEPDQASPPQDQPGSKNENPD